MSFKVSTEQEYRVYGEEQWNRAHFDDENIGQY